MNRRHLPFVFVALLTLLAVAGASAQGPRPQDVIQATANTAFTYQGRLANSGAPVNAPTDFQFVLYTAPIGGTQLGTRIVKLDRVPVANGLFSVELDFGTVFDGAPVYLEVGVRPSGSSDSYTTFSPRTALTAVPYALGLAPGTTVNTSDPANNAAALTGRVALTTAGEASAGLRGLNEGTGTSSYGVYGEQKGKGSGVYGRAAAGYGVYGSSTSGTGVWGASDSGFGLVGLSTSSRGVTGLSNGGEGVYGTSSKSYGVHGDSTDSAGIYGRSTNNSGIVGESASASYAIAAVLGTNTGKGYGVLGVATNDYGVSGEGSSGVYGKSNSADGDGVVGIATNGRGVFGSSSYGIGVRGFSGAGVAIYGNGPASSGYAGYFDGRVHVNGTLTKAGGSFKIDHPLDPANKYLYHSFVESPDMKNIYDGLVTLDEKGEAVVTMPDWFEPLNQDFRYQLTAIGAPGPNLYVAQEIQGNRFTIAGGSAGIKVSWQVTGIRHDAWANAHRIPIEQDKPTKERGTYLHPTEQGQPESKGEDYEQQIQKTVEK